jgi:protein ImuA
MKRSSDQPNETTRKDIVSLLQRQLHRLDGSQPIAVEDVIGSGCEALDALLPMGGLRRGKLVEWLSAVGGGGVATLSLSWAQRIQAAGGSLVVFDSQQNFYPPAAAALGIDLERLIVVRPSCREDEHWTWHQVLQCQAVTAAWGWIDQLDNRTFRRWQLAAESSGAIGFLLRPASVRGQPSWAEMQLQVTPCPSNQGSGLDVELARCRGAVAGGKVTVDLAQILNEGRRERV